MNKSGNNWVIYSYMMLVTPLISLLMSLRDRRLSRNGVKWLFIIFITIFGSLISFDFKEGDAYDHQMVVYENYTNKTFSEFTNELYSILSFQHGKSPNNDVYLHTLSYLVGSILKMPGSLFLFVSFFYAYFYIGSIFKVIRLLGNTQWTFILLIFIFGFIGWKTIHDMQTIRTWTGLWVMFYGALSYFETGMKRDLGLLALPPLIHFGYFIMVIPAWIVAIFKNKKLLFTILFGISFLTQIIPQQYLLNQLKSYPLGEKKVQGYFYSPEESAGANDETIEIGQRRFYKFYRDLKIHIFGVIGATVIIILSGAYFLYMNYIEGLLFSVGLLCKTTSNLFFFIFAINNRAEHLSAVFVLAAIVLLLSRQVEWRKKISLFKLRSIKFLLSICGISFIPFIIFKIAGFLGWASFFLIFFPFIPWLTEINFSIKDSILHLFGI